MKTTSDLTPFYKEKRNALIESFYDPAFKNIKEKIGWSDKDEAANTKLKGLKTAVTNQKGYFQNPYESQYFNKVIDDIQKTDLFAFLKGLPKGGILHLHPSSIGDYRALIHLAADYKGDTCQVRFLYQDSEKTIINPINTDFSSFQWVSEPTSTAHSDPNLGPYMNLKDALADPKLRQAAYDLIILSPDVMDYPEDIWNLFVPMFPRAGTLFSKLEIKIPFYNNAFNYLAHEDNITHVELRLPWNTADEKISGTTENVIATAAKNAGISLKIIYVNSRHVYGGGKEKNVIKNIVKTGKAIQNKESDYLCGYDLVGEEDTGATTAFVEHDLYQAFCELGNYLPPFFFHDGESNLPPDDDPTDAENLDRPESVYFNNNLIDAYLLNTMNFDGFQMTTNRVGHGLELFKTPKLLEDYKKAGLAVEICPISNQLLRYVKDLREHPGQSYLAAGLPVSLSPDDPAMYGYQGVSFDFWEAVMAWGLDLKMVKVLCYFSLSASALNDAEKKTAIGDWKAKWDEYIKSCV